MITQILFKIGSILQNQVRNILVGFSSLKQTLIDLPRIFHRRRYMLRPVPGDVVQIDRFFEIFKRIAIQLQGSNGCPLAYLICNQMVQGPVHRIRRFELTMRIGRRQVT